MGGLISSFISADESLKMNYDGAIYSVPYFDVHDKNMLEKMRPLVEMVKAVSPDKALPLNWPSKKHLEEWLRDDLEQGSSISPHNLEVNDRAFAAFKQERIPERITNPTLILRSGLDKVVSNSKIDEFF